MMFKRLINWLQQLRNPKGIIYCQDGKWFISHVRFLDCGVELSHGEMKIKLFDDDGANVCVTSDDHDIIPESVIINCEFHNTGYREG